MVGKKVLKVRMHSREGPWAARKLCLLGIVGGSLPILSVHFLAEENMASKKIHDLAPKRLQWDTQESLSPKADWR